MTYLKNLRLLYLTVILLAVFSRESNAQVQTARTTSMTSNSQGFYEYLPEGYGSGTQTYPLIIFVHGQGELGNGTTQLSKVIGTGLPALIQQGKFPKSFTVNGQVQRFIVLSPQFVAWPKPDDINNIIDYAIRNYRVNANKIYVTGLSMGGGATWEVAANANLYNKRIAAIVPICGASGANNTKGNRIADADLPVWATHNDGDGTVPVSWTKDWLSFILARNAKAPVKMTIFQASGHDAWTKTYDPSFKENNMNIYEWMLQYQKNVTTVPNQAPIAKAGTSTIITLPVNILQLNGSGSSDPDGTIAKYAWTKVSGPSLSVINNAAIVNPLLTSLVEGVYVYRLTVTDDKGATAYSDITITVKPLINLPPTANAGADFTVTLPNSAALSGSGADQGGSITAYEWTQVSGPSQSKITDKTKAQTTVSNLVQGAYVFQLKVTDNSGSTAVDQVTLTVKVLDPTQPSTPVGTPKYVKVSIYSGKISYANEAWNNWDISASIVSNITSGVLKYSDKTTSAIKVNLSQSRGINDNYATYGSGMAPAEVLRYTSYSTVARTLTISGLSASKTYSIELYASRRVENNSTIFKIGSLSKEVATYNNYTNKVEFINLIADAKGQIVIIIDKKNAYSYLNGFVITENPGTVTPKSTMPIEIVSALPETSLKDNEAMVSTASIFPNPVADRFTIELNDAYTGEMNIQLIDMSGTVRSTFKSIKDQQHITRSYAVSGNLSPGNYILRIIMHNTIKTIKFVKL